MSSWPSPVTATARSPRCSSPRAARRLDGLDAMIVSFYAGGMTVRDIGHHLVSTIGTELSQRRSKIATASPMRCSPGSNALWRRCIR